MDNKEVVKEILRKALTPGTALYEKLASGKYERIADELCDIALNEWDIPSLRKVNIRFAVYPWLAELWETYSEDQDADKAINQFLDHIEWPPYLAVYTHLPPKTEFTASDIPSEEELNRIPAHFPAFRLGEISEVLVSLARYKQIYEKGKNPVLLMRAFLTALDKGLYPAPWVLREIASVFRAFLSKSEDKRSKGGDLTSLFGFYPGNKFFKIDRQQRRDQKVMHDIYRLSYLEGLSIRDACEIEVRRLNDMEPSARDRLGIDMVSAERLEDIYAKAGYASAFKMWDGLFHPFEMQDWEKEGKKEFEKYFPKRRRKR